MDLEAQLVGFYIHNFCFSPAMIKDTQEARQSTAHPFSVWVQFATGVLLRVELPHPHSAPTLREVKQAIRKKYGGGDSFLFFQGTPLQHGVPLPQYDVVPGNVLFLLNKNFVKEPHSPQLRLPKSSARKVFELAMCLQRTISESDQSKVLLNVENAVWGVIPFLEILYRRHLSFRAEDLEELLNAIYGSILELKQLVAEAISTGNKESHSSTQDMLLQCIKGMWVSASKIHTNSFLFRYPAVSWDCNPEDESILTSLSNQENTEEAAYFDAKLYDFVMIEKGQPEVIAAGDQTMEAAEGGWMMLVKSLTRIE